jgi:NOL1/NOP2/fmu family ribosome biogenesis protein
MNNPTPNLTILNSKEKKNINDQIKNQWGAEFDRSYVFIISNKDRMYIANPEIAQLDFNKIKIDKVGLYVCNVGENGIRLTIEGAQILGPVATKNIFELSPELIDSWFGGADLQIKAEGMDGYIIMKYKNDFVGCGKATAKQILNYIPKVRRISNLN